MNKINIENYARIAAEDESLLSELYSCVDAKSTIETMKRAITASGYELTGFQKKLANLSDDDLGSVMGGANPFIPLRQGEINPYSWFVSFLRMLLGMDNGTESPEQRESQSF
jgi:hypothetical protein